MKYLLLFMILALCISCNDTSTTTASGSDSSHPGANKASDYISQKLAGYATVRLTADLSHLSDSDKKVLPLLIQAAQIMDTLFWLQTYGNPDSLLNATPDGKAKQFIAINYGPWDRLNNDTPFIAGIGKKPEGANFIRMI